MKVKESVIRGLDATGMHIFEPVVRLLTGEAPRQQIRQIGLYFGIPLLAFGVFLGAWTLVAQKVETKYGTLPTPAAVWAQAGVLFGAHLETQAKRASFEAEKAKKIAVLETHLAGLEAKRRELTGSADEAMRTQIGKVKDLLAETKAARFSSGPSYIDQILTSLKTVFAGFVIASLMAVPLGILCGLSPVFQAAMNPLIQIFKPVSPLAWLPIVMICVGALYTTDPADAWFEKSFVSSAFTVALCSLWPTLVNTALGVASIEKDHMNVARVLKLDWWTRVRKIVVPSALPLMFAGLRISLGVGWMVLIAAEMLAQNPGLGKFVWDMFQNGSSETLAQIMVAVFTIGIIGFLLDRVMIAMQRAVSYERLA